MNTTTSTGNDSPGLILSELSPLTRHIDTGIKESEPPFLRLGEGLSTAYSESGELLEALTHGADQFSDTGEGNPVREVESVIHRVSDELDAYPVRIDRDMEVMNRAVNRLEKLCSSNQRLQNISKYLNIIAINFSIESSRSKEAVAMFEGFAGELKVLSQRSAGIVSTINHNSQTAITQQKRKMAEVTEKVARIKTLSLEARESVLHTMENIRAISNQSIRTLNSAGNTATAIQTGTGEIVMSIQFHDIARQRLEHVISALSDVESLAAPLPAQTRSTLALQAEQIGHVAGDIEKARESIVAALSGIREKVTGLKVEMTGDANSPVGTLEAFNALTDKLKDLGKIQDQARHIGEEMTASIQESARVVSALSQSADEIRDINTDIQYKALNAIIMTNKLGDKGRTLGVLAREVRDLSFSCNTGVEDVVSHLEKIQELTTLLDHTGEENEKKSSETTLSDNINTISTVMEGHTLQAATITQRIELLEKHLEQVSLSLPFMDNWLDRLRSDRTTLSDITTRLAPFIREGKDEGDAQDPALSKRYTMESERAVHRNMSKKNEGRGETDASGTDDDTELDDNIELF